MSLGKRIKSRREELGLTQPELAKMVNVSKGTIGNYESGVSCPNEPILIKLFFALDCDANYLYADDLQNLEKDDIQSNFTLSKCEKILIEAYRKNPDMQSSVNRLLKIEDEINNAKAKKNT